MTSRMQHVRWITLRCQSMGQYIRNELP